MVRCGDYGLFILKKVYLKHSTPKALCPLTTFYHFMLKVTRPSDTRPGFTSVQEQETMNAIVAARCDAIPNTETNLLESRFLYLDLFRISATPLASVSCPSGAGLNPDY